MNVNSYATQSANDATVERKWYVVDAAGMTVGRLASQVAAILRGKHKPSYTPHVDCGDYVIVINAEQARFSGKKETEKLYFRYTGFPGGERFRSPKEVRTRKPEFIVENAIKGMLPHNALGRKMFRKLKVVVGDSHQHAAQNPEVLTF